MTMVMRTTYVTTLRTMRMPRAAAAAAIPSASGTQALIEDGFGHGAIGSFQALGLAVVASVLVTGLLWVMP